VEATDLVYLVLKKNLDGITIGNKKVEVGYVYDYKTVNVREKDWVLLYESGENIRFAELGGSIVFKTVTVTVDVRTDSKYNYAQLKDKMNVLFGFKYSFEEGTPTDITSLVTSKDIKGAYVDKLVLSDVSGLSEGDYVQYDSEKGWIFWINGDEVWVFKKAGRYILSKPTTLTDLSNKIKMLYRFVMQVEVWILENV